MRNASIKTDKNLPSVNSSEVFKNPKQINAQRERDGDGQVFMKI